ncbi:hypothetical protein Tco_0517503 [Tanacetum coccineum]
MPNPEDISDPTTEMNMALVLMAKAFKFNYSTPTNNNQIISSNPHNRQIVQPGMNMGQDRISGIGLDRMQFRIQNGNGNVIAARDEGNCNGNNGNQIRCYNYRGLGHYARNAQLDQGEGMLLTFRLSDINEIEEVNANCILMANLQQASTSGTQTDKVPVYNSDGSVKNDINVIYANSSMEHSGRTVEQQTATVE